MTAKIDLIAKLTALMPECAREIIKIMREYDVQTAQVYDRSNLPRRVEAFLAAKRIDGCRPKTIKGYRERLQAVHDAVQQAGAADHDRRSARVSRLSRRRAAFDG